MSYEEGTWTPTLANIEQDLIRTQVGRYTKIGNLVTVDCNVNINVLEPGSDLQILRACLLLRKP
jgi:hypothetical protein